MQILFDILCYFVQSSHNYISSIAEKKYQYINCTPMYHMSIILCYITHNFWIYENNHIKNMKMWPLV